MKALSSEDDLVTICSLEAVLSGGLLLGAVADSRGSAALLLLEGAAVACSFFGETALARSCRSAGRASLTGALVEGFSGLDLATWLLLIGLLTLAVDAEVEDDVDDATL